jgi:hypothetical protein
VGNNLLCRYFTTVNVLDASHLIGFQTCYITVYPLNTGASSLEDTLLLRPDGAGRTISMAPGELQGSRMPEAA